MNKIQEQGQNELSKIFLDSWIKILEIKLPSVEDSDVEPFVRTIINLKNIRATHKFF